MRREADLVDAELRARDLEDEIRDALPDFRGGAVDLGRAVLEESYARRAIVVEPLREADVLVAGREADAAADALAARRVARTAREPERVAWQLLRLGRLERRGRADDLGDRQRARDALPGRKGVAWTERVQQAQLDRVDRELGRQLVHLGLSRERGLDGAEAAHRPTRRVVGVDDRRLEQR